MKKRCIISFLVAFVLMSSYFTLNAYADQQDHYISEEFVEEYAIASNPSSTLSISGNSATLTSTTNGKNAISITVEHTLQKRSGLWSWNAVDNATWSKTANTNTIRLTSSKKALTSGTYRVKSTFTLTNSSGQTEVITIYSSEKTVS